MLEPEIQHSHFHDGELCQLLHALDQPMSEPVKKAIRKAVRGRVKRLGMKYDNEVDIDYLNTQTITNRVLQSINQYRKSYHDHDHNPAVHLTGEQVAGLNQLVSMEEPPEWAKNLIENLANLSTKIDRVDTKVDRVVELRSSRGGGSVLTDNRYHNGHQQQYAPSEGQAYTQSLQTANIPQPTEPDDDMYTEPRHDHHLAPHDEEDYFDDDDGIAGTLTQDGDPRGLLPSDYNSGQHSPGQQYLEEELYKLRVKPTGSQSVATHKTWEVARDDGGEFDEGDTQAAVTESGLPEIPDAHTGGAYTERSLPPVPADDGASMLAPNWTPVEANGPPPWQRIHQRLLSWAIVWPMGELEHALNSTTRGHQVDEVALSIWSTQSYKRYVRSRMTESSTLR